MQRVLEFEKITYSYISNEEIQLTASGTQMKISLLITSDRISPRLYYIINGVFDFFPRILR